MPYLVLPYDTGSEGYPGMQSFINEKAAEGYELMQAVQESTYDWVLFFKAPVDQRSAA
jgi:hypothetical protein